MLCSNTWSRSRYPLWTTLEMSSASSSAVSYCLHPCRPHKRSVQRTESVKTKRIMRVAWRQRTDTHTIAKGQFWRVNCDHVRHRRSFSARIWICCILRAILNALVLHKSKNVHYRIIDCKRAAFGIRTLVWVKDEKKIIKFDQNLSCERNNRFNEAKSYGIWYYWVYAMCVCVCGVRAPTNRFELTFQAKVINSPSMSVERTQRSYGDRSLAADIILQLKISKRNK